MKIAVYVEGQTELIFVRELLKMWYNYNQSEIGFRCYNLRNAEAPGFPAEYGYGSEQSANFYEIINVGTDTSVLSVAIKNGHRHQNLGYSHVVALRDMFSDNYHKEVHKLRGARMIHPPLNERFITGAEKSIEQKGFSGYIHINFAIMEVECWLLGMGWYLEKEDPNLTQEYLLVSHGLDLDADQETTIYHPAGQLKEIYRTIGKNYDKHSGDVCSIMAKLEKTDFEMLLDLPKCKSFNQFISNLIPG